MPRRRYHRHSSSRDKYSIEQTTIRTPILNDWAAVEATTETDASHQFNMPIIPPTAVEGMRKVKHLTFTISNGASAGESVPLYYAIVYVPQGYAPQPLRIPLVGQAASLYYANQFVMSSGVLDFSGGPLRIRSPLSRNLNSGDSIYLVLATLQSYAASSFFIEVQYAITLQ